MSFITDFSQIDSTDLTDKRFRRKEISTPCFPALAPPLIFQEPNVKASEQKLEAARCPQEALKTQPSEEASRLLAAADAIVYAAVAAVFLFFVF